MSGLIVLLAGYYLSLILPCLAVVGTLAYLIRRWLRARIARDRSEVNARMERG